MKLPIVFVVLMLCCGLFLAESEPVAAARNSVSERTYRELSRVHELMQQQRYAEALAGLDRMRSRVKRKPYENALVLQTYGYIYARQEQYQQAVDALTACLALKKLPKPAAERTLYALAQLQMTVADYGAAVVSLERWFELTKKPTPDAHALAGSAHALSQDYAKAVKHLTQALELAGKPKERWYQQLLAVYYESGKYTKAAELLQKMVVHFPQRKDYWLQMSSVYRELGKDAKALAALEIAYDRGLIAEEADLLRLVHYYRYLGLPHKAGKILQTGLQKGGIKASAEHWRLLTDVWIRARETDLALAASEKSLQKMEQGDVRLTQAELLASKEEWSAVIDAVKQALSHPELSSPGPAHLLQGVAHYQLQQLDKALVSFRKATDFDDTRSQAQQWIQFIAMARQPPARDASLYLSHRQL
jgi:tetratricopeptide (TPR) repeat protein